FALLQGLPRPAFLGNVMKDQDNPDYLPCAVFDGRCTVLDGDLPPFAGDQGRMISKVYNAPVAQHAADDVLSRFAGLLVNYPENAPDRLSECIFRLPACQCCSNGIEEGDIAGGIGCDHRIADAVESDPQPFPIPAQFLFGQL